MLSAVRRAAVFLAAMALAPAAHAAAPAVTAHATPATGAAPLQVTLTAAGDAATYHWDLGDGTAADGAVVQHTYAAGRFTARVTATNALGETAQATVAITATGITLAGPRSGRYQQLARFHGRLIPAAKGIRVALYRNTTRIATVRTGRGGSVLRPRPRRHTGRAVHGPLRGSRLERGRAGGAARARHRLQRLRPARHAPRADRARAPGRGRARSRPRCGAGAGSSPGVLSTAACACR